MLNYVASICVGVMWEGSVEIRITNRILQIFNTQLVKNKDWIYLLIKYLNNYLIYNQYLYYSRLIYLPITLKMKTVIRIIIISH